MIKPVILFAFAILLFAACSGKKEGNVTSLKFKTIIVDKTMRHPDAKSDMDELNYKVRFTYPSRFNDIKILKLLQSHFLENTFECDPSTWSPDEIVVAFVDDWRAEYRINQYELGMNWGLEVSDSILYFSDELLQYRIYRYEFKGGAHPSTSTSYHLLNLQTGNEYTQTDIFKPDAADEIRKLIIPKIFEYWNKPEDNQMKESINDYVWTPKTNFGVTPEGIIIGYSAYELGAYAFGSPEVMISYDQIQPFLNENTPVYSLAVSAVGTEQ